MFEDLDDPQAPAPSPQLRDTVVRIAVHRRMRRRLVGAAIATAVVALPVALVATGRSETRHFSVSSASDNRPSTTVITPSGSRPRPAGARPPRTTPTTWNGVLHCDARPFLTRQVRDQTLTSAQRFGRWIVTTRGVGDHEALAVQDCSTNKSRGVPAPPPGRDCANYDWLDMGADVLLYRCSYADGASEVVVNDLTKNTVQIVPELSDLPWRSGLIAPGGGFVAYTGVQSGGSYGNGAEAVPGDVFVYDLAAKTLDRLPRDFAGGTDRNAAAEGISIDGQTVLVTTGPVLSTQAVNAELYLFDRVTRGFTRVPAPDRLIGAAALSGDGRHVGFTALPTAEHGPAVYAYDAGASSAAFISLCGASRSQLECRVGISEDGGTVTFTAEPCVSVTGTADRTGGTYTFDRAKGTIHKDADAAETRDCTPPASS